MPSLLLLLACAGRDPGDDDPTRDPTGLPTAAELAVLAGAADAFLADVPDVDAGRQAALAHLSADPLVADAALHGDAVPVRFTSGTRAGVHTLWPGPDELGFDDVAALIRGWWPPMAFTRSPRAQRPPPTQAPSSHRVLMIATGAEQSDGSEIVAFEARRDELVEAHCYDPADVVILSNRAEDGYATIHAEDLLDMSGYGLVIMNTPTSYGFDDDFSLDSIPMIQVGATGDPSALDGTLLAEETMEVMQVTDPTGGGSRAYDHLDLLTWAERVTFDPGAMFFMSGSDGMYAANPLLARGAGAFVGWTGFAPSAYGAETTALLPAHLVHGGAPLMETLTQAAAMWGESEFDIPVPDARVADGDVGMPTWMDVGVSGWPDGTVSVRTTLAYADPTLSAPDPATLEDVPSSANTFDGLVPGQEIIVTAEAIGGDGEVLGTATTRTTADPGGCNELLVPFRPQAVTLLATPDALLADSGDDVLVQVATWDWDPDAEGWVAVPDASVRLTTSLGSWAAGGDAVVLTTGDDGVASAVLWPGTAAGVAHVEATWGDQRATTDVRIVDAAWFADFEAAVGPEWSTTARAAFGGDLYLGPLGEDGATLTLTDLPAHAAVTVELDIVLTGNWSGGWIGVDTDAGTRGLAWGPGTLSGSGAVRVGATFPEHDATFTARFWAMPDSWQDDDDPHDWGIDDVAVTLTAP